MSHGTVNVKEAAKILNVHTNTVKRLIGQCVIRAGKAGSAYIMLEKDVMDYAMHLITTQTEQRMRGKL